MLWLWRQRGLACSDCMRAAPRWALPSVPSETPLLPTLPSVPSRALRSSRRALVRQCLLLSTALPCGMMAPIQGACPSLCATTATPRHLQACRAACPVACVHTCASLHACMHEHIHIGTHKTHTHTHTHTHALSLSLSDTHTHLCSAPIRALTSCMRPGLGRQR